MKASRPPGAPLSPDILLRYPGVADKPEAMALMCGALIELGRHADAYALGRAALAAAPDDTVVRDLVRKTLSRDVPGFHMAMLRDVPRNACYAAAIERMVTPGMLVLEIGTGAGLLALLAARAGAEVITCESNPVIAAAAREIVARNGFSDRVTVVCKRSTDLRIGVDLPRRCDSLVSEIFGDDLVEEGVVRSINDARERLLLSDAVVIPARAELRLALVMHERLERLERSGLDDVLGFDLSPFAALTQPNRYLPRREMSHVAMRSSPVSALALDFTGRLIDAASDRVLLHSKGGRVDGVAHWLRLDFGDGVVYENEPFVSPLAHWHVPVDALASPLDTSPGQAVEAHVRVLGCRLIVTGHV